METTRGVCVAAVFCFPSFHGFVMIYVAFNHLDDDNGVPCKKEHVKHDRATGPCLPMGDETQPSGKRENKRENVRREVKKD